MLKHLDIEGWWADRSQGFKGWFIGTIAMTIYASGVYDGAVLRPEEYVGHPFAAWVSSVVAISLACAAVFYGVDFLAKRRESDA